MIELKRFEGGRRLLLGAMTAGVLGLGLTGLGGAFRLRQALYSYLVAYLFWMGIALTALILLGILHAAHARWTVVIRRVLEVMALTLVLFALLFVPIAVWMDELFYWAQPSAELSRHASEILARRRFFLNPPFFLIRAVLYFGVWIAVAALLWRSSVRQDLTGEARLTVRQRLLGAGSLPVLGLTMTFATYDWMMSPSPDFFSQIIGAYYFGGSMIAVLALVIVAGALARGEGLFGRHLGPSHFSNLGKLLLTFTAFWAWMAFSQFMLMWIANLPSEIVFWEVRMRPGWGWLGGVLILGQFVLPFFALLSRDLKRHRGLLAAVALWTLVVHYVDVYFIVMPMLARQAPRPWFTDLTALVGVGGLALAMCVGLLRGRFTLPVGDPYLGQSLRYDR